MPATPAEDWKHPCHYLWRGPMYVKQNGDVYPCCQSYMLDGAPLGNIAEQPLGSIWNGAEMQDMRRAARRRAGRRDRHLRALLHHDSASRRWWRAACCSTARRCAGWCRWWSGWSIFPSCRRKLLRPPAAAAPTQDLVQIHAVRDGKPDRGGGPG